MILFTCIYWILTWIQSVCMLVWISGTVAGLMLCFVCIVVRDKSTSQINASGDVVVCLAFPVRTSVKFWSKKLNDLHFFWSKMFRYFGYRFRVMNCLAFCYVLHTYRMVCRATGPFRFSLAYISLCKSVFRSHSESSDLLECLHLASDSRTR